MKNRNVRNPNDHSHSKPHPMNTSIFGEFDSLSTWRGGEESSKLRKDDGVRLIICRLLRRFTPRKDDYIKRARCRNNRPSNDCLPQNPKCGNCIFKSERYNFSPCCVISNPSFSSVWQTLRGDIQFVSLSNR